MIIGAKSIAQLDDNLAAADIQLSAEELSALDKASAIAREYPGWMLDRDLTFCDRHGTIKNVFDGFHDRKIRQCRTDQEDEEQRRRCHEPQPPANHGE